jgi:integrase
MKAIVETKKFKMTSSLGDLKEKAKQVFDLMDITGSSRLDYSYRIGLFLEFIIERGLHKDSFLEFKRYLEGREDLTVATKNKYLASARVFLKELARNRAIPVDITLNVKSFKQGRKHKKEGLSEGEIERLAHRIKTLPDTPRNTRLKALFCLFALQGLRQVEVVRLNLEDLDLVSGIAHIQGKGRDDKEPVYLNPETIKALKHYIDLGSVGSGALFKSLGNRKSKRLNSRTIKREFEALFKELGINKTVHGFRHYYITHLLKSFEVGTVRKFSRHKSLDMLIVYDDEVNLSEKKDKVFACFKSIKIG